MADQVLTKDPSEQVVKARPGEISLRTGLQWLAFITVTGLVLRLTRLGDRAFWLDEVFSLGVSDHPLGEIWNWANPAEPADPPLYFALLRGWRLLFGSSEAAVRSLSVLFGTALIPVGYALGASLKSRRVGLVVAGLVAVSALHIKYAQEARMYPLLSLLLAIAATSVVWLVANRDTSKSFARWAWIAYSLTAGLSLLTHHAAGFFLVGLNGAVVWIFRREIFPPTSWVKKWLLANVGAILVWATWLPALPVQLDWYRSGGSEAFEGVTFDTMARAVFSMVQDRLPNAYQFLPFRQIVTLVLAAAFGALFLLGVRSLRPGQRGLLLGSLAGAIGMPLALFFLGSDIFVTRILTPTSLLILVGLAAGINLFGKRLAAIVLGLVVAMNLIGTGVHVMTYDSEDWDLVAGFIDTNADEADAVLFLGEQIALPFDVYYEEDAESPELLDLEEADVEAAMDNSSGFEDVFLIVSHWKDPNTATSLVEQFSEHRPLVASNAFEGIDTYTFGAARP